MHVKDAVIDVMIQDDRPVADRLLECAEIVSRERDFEAATFARRCLSDDFGIPPSIQSAAGALMIWPHKEIRVYAEPVLRLWLEGLPPQETVMKVAAYLRSKVDLAHQGAVLSWMKLCLGVGTMDIRAAMTHLDRLDRRTKREARTRKKQYEDDERRRKNREQRLAIKEAAAGDSAVGELRKLANSLRALQRSSAEPPKIAIWQQVRRLADEQLGSQV